MLRPVNQIDNINSRHLAHSRSHFQYLFPTKDWFLGKLFEILYSFENNTFENWCYEQPIPDKLDTSLYGSIQK